MMERIIKQCGDQDFRPKSDTMSRNAKIYLGVYSRPARSFPIDGCCAACVWAMKTAGGLGMLICSAWHDGTYHQAMWRSRFSAKFSYHEQKCENLPWCIYATSTKFSYRWLLCGLCMSYEDFRRLRHAYMQCLTWWNVSSSNVKIKKKWKFLKIFTR